MLEQWNTGIMGSGRLGQWFVGKTLLTRKLINEKLPLKSTFHYSLAQTWVPWTQFCIFGL
jgi:hypothetical protein